MAESQLRLLTVHAHPDDESSKGAATVAKYHHEGVETTLVCCTGGELGEILNPAMDSESIRNNLHKVRMEELERAAKVIGFDHVEMLGYRDSGMAGTDANADKRSFAQAPMENAVEKLVRLIRRYQPQVIITYGDNQEIYPHPDHLKVHDITVRAFDAAGDKTMYPDSGAPFSPAKLYYSVMSKTKMKIRFEAVSRAGVELPFTMEQIEALDSRITTEVNVKNFLEVRADALRAHATQIDPDSPMWFGLGADEERQVYGTDDYFLARTNVDSEVPEIDLFVGLR